MTATALARYLLPLAAAAVLVVSLISATKSSHAAGGTVSVQPASQVTHVGDTVAVDLGVAGASNLASWELWLKWDPAVLSFDSAENGDFLASSGRSPYCILPVVDATAGTVHLGCNSTGPVVDSTPTPGATGDGLLARVRLTANAVGDTNIEFDKAQLSDPISTDSCCIPEVHEGAVRVTEAASAPLPPTPTPNPAKLSPTVVSNLDPGFLVLHPGANATAAAGGSPVPVGAAGGPSSGPGSPVDGDDVAVDGIGNVSGAAGGTGAPRAGDGTQVRSRSLAVDVLAGLLAAGGIACVAMAGRVWRRQRQ